MRQQLFSVEVDLTKLLQEIKWCSLIAPERIHCRLDTADVLEEIEFRRTLRRIICLLCNNVNISDVLITKTV